MNHLPPKTSNIYQVLVSILGLIFVKDPFFNEPAYNGQEEIYQKQSETYNRDIRYNTLKYAILVSFVTIILVPFFMLGTVYILFKKKGPKFIKNYKNKEKKTIKK